MLAIALVSCRELEGHRMVVERASEAEFGAGLGHDLERFLDAAARYPDAVSAGVLVALDGEILLAKGYGVADVDTDRRIDRASLWDVASITKQFTAAGILVLQQQGKLALDDALAKFFVDVPADKADVTIRQLLNHTSGIANSYDYEQAGKTVDFARKEPALEFYLHLPMVAEPGAEWAYSNLAYNIVAAIIEQVTGETWEEFVRERVLRPAGMEESWALGDPELPSERVPRGSKGEGPAFPYGVVSHWAGYRGAGGIHTTLDDLFRWDRALRTEGLLTEASRAVLFTPALNDYALGWRIDRDAGGRRRASHGGAVNGFVSHFMRGLEQDLVVAVLTNEFSPGGASEIAELLYGMVQAGHAIVPGEAVELSPETLAGYAGRFAAGPASRIDVRAGSGGLDVAILDWKAATAILRQDGKIVNGGATVDRLLPEALDAFDRGNQSHVAPGVSEQAVAEWQRLFRGYTGFDSIGYYFAAVGRVEQFARVRLRDGESLVRFTWFAGNLTDVTVDPPAFATLEFESAGARVFRHGTAQSWRAALVEFTPDGLRLNGDSRPFSRPLLSEN
jgi:CubicO group peptidase (beta-lactamase class C family)